MYKNEWLLYALILGGIVHLYVILNQLGEAGGKPFLSIIFSMITFLIVVSPGWVLNLLAFHFENRILALFAALAYFYAAFYFILVLLLLAIPGIMCFYAFLTMPKHYRSTPKKT